MHSNDSPLRIEPLPGFGATVHGIDLEPSLGDDALAPLRDAFETYSLLIFPGQALSSAGQVRFSGYFGPLEQAISRQSDQGPGLNISLLSNVDDDGALIPASHRSQQFNAANGFWHTDSSYKPLTAMASLLYARRVPPRGGETEYVSTRTAFSSLADTLREKVKSLWAVHDFQRSRDMVAPDLVEPRVQKMLPPVARPLVRYNPINGAGALYIASHADYIEGMSREEGRELLDVLMEHCIRPGGVYTHRWTAGDLLMWDNRCTLHRGRPWDADRHARVMARTTVIDAGYDAEMRQRPA